MSVKSHRLYATSVMLEHRRGECASARLRAKMNALLGGGRARRSTCAD